QSEDLFLDARAAALLGIRCSRTHASGRELTMAGFDPAEPAAGQICCSSPCANARAADDRLSDATAARIQSLTGEAVPANAGPDAPPQAPAPGDASACAKKASTLAPVLQRFNRYRDALPSA